METKTNLIAAYLSSGLQFNPDDVDSYIDKVLEYFQSLKYYELLFNHFLYKSSSYELKYNVACALSQSGHYIQAEKLLREAEGIFYCEYK